MGLLLRWLRVNRRRRFVDDGGNCEAADTGGPDMSVGLAIAAGGDPGPYCDSSAPATCCDTSSGTASFDSGACSAPPDVSSTSF
jgi:hypothetical protein